MLFLVAFILVFAVRSFFNEEITYSVESLETKAGPGWIELRWKSVHPYPSSVVITNTETKSVNGPAAAGSAGDSTAKERVINGDDGDPVRKHRVKIDRLAEGSEVTFHIVYPNGERSLPRTVEVPVMRFNIVDVEREHNSLVLSWTPLLGERAGIVLEGAVRMEYNAFKAGNRWEVSMPVPGPDMKKAFLSIVFADGDKRLVDLAPLIRRLSEGLSRKLRNNRPSAIVAKMDRKFNELSSNGNTCRREARAEYARSFRKTLEDAGILEAYLRLSALSPLVFRTSLMKIEDRAKIYRNMTDVIQMVLYSPNFFGRVELMQKAVPEFYDFACLRAPSVKEGQLVTIYDTTQPKLREPACPVVSGSLPSVWRGNFSITSSEAIKAAELEVRFGNFGSNVLRVRINGRSPEFMLYDAEMTRGEDFRINIINTPVDGKGSIQWDKLAVAGVSANRLYQRIPACFLRDGENTFEMYCSTLAPHRARRAAEATFCASKLSIRKEYYDLTKNPHTLKLFEGAASGENFGSTAIEGELEKSELPAAIAIAVDRSRSSSRIYKLVCDSVKNWINKIPAGDRASVMFFAGKQNMTKTMFQPLTDNKSKLIALIEEAKKRKRNKSPLKNATFIAVDSLQYEDMPEDTALGVVVLSDGKDRPDPPKKGPCATPDEIKMLACTLRAPIFTVGLPKIRRTCFFLQKRDMVNNVDPELLEMISNDTGGGGDDDDDDDDDDNNSGGDDSDDNHIPSGAAGEWRGPASVEWTLELCWKDDGADEEYVIASGTSDGDVEVITPLPAKFGEETDKTLDTIRRFINNVSIEFDALPDPETGEIRYTFLATQPTVLAKNSTIPRPNHLSRTGRRMDGAPEPCGTGSAPAFAGPTSLGD